MRCLKTLIPLVLPLTFMVIACKTQRGLLSSRNTLRGADWILIEDGKAVKANGRPLYIHFLSKGFQAYAGCGAISGNYKVEGAQISLQKTKSSQAKCEDMHMQDTFLSLLGQADHFRIQGEEISLYKDKMLLLQFRRQATR